MKKTNEKQEYDNLIGQKLAAAFGYSDEQLIAEYDSIADEPFDMDDPGLKVPEDGFENLLARLREEKEEKVEHVEERVEKKSVKVIRLKRMAKTMILVAAFATVMLSSGIGASGQRRIEYWLRIPENEENRIIWNNTDALYMENSEAEAYQKIREELGINVLSLSYMPSEMKFKGMEIDKRCARLEFVYDDQYLTFFQTLYAVDSSVSTVSDRKDVKKIHNRILNLDLLIEKEVQNGGSSILSTEFAIGKAYYYIEAKVDEKEFCNIVKMIEFFE